MNKELEKQLAAVFERDYVNYDYFIDNVINKIFIGDEVFEALPVPENILDETNRTAASNAGIQSIFKIGSIDAIEGIDIYDITLCDSKQLQYNRVRYSIPMHSCCSIMKIQKERNGVFRFSTNKGKIKILLRQNVIHTCLAEVVKLALHQNALHSLLTWRKIRIIC